MTVLHPLCDHGRIPVDCDSCRIELRRQGEAHLLDTCRHGRLSGTCASCSEREVVLSDEATPFARIGAERLKAPADHPRGAPTAGTEGADRREPSVEDYRVTLWITGPGRNIDLTIADITELSDEAIEAIVGLVYLTCVAGDATTPYASQDEERGRGGTRGVDDAVPPPATGGGMM